MNSFNKIYHISDLHIRQMQRHQEYREVFQTFYQILRDSVDDKAVLVCTGDILHSKTQLTPECIALTKEFFETVSKILPIVIIAGNHDANLSNLARLDALTPILDGVDVTYLKDTGIYQMRNLSFGVISVFDETFPDMKLHPPDKLKIALYHGTLHGAKTDDGYQLQSSITESQFAGYDLTLLGDIHRHQFLTPRVEYAGSLIQQNFGEHLSHHGMVVWDLVNMKSEFVEVPNKYGYATFHLVDNILSKPDGCLPEKCRVRLLYQNSDTISVKKVCADLEAQYKSSIVVARRIKDRNDHTGNTDNTDYSNLIEQNNKIDFEVLMKTVCDKHAIAADVVDAALVKHRELFELKELEQSNCWHLVDLEFDNLFCYGIGNKIDFSKCQKIMGLLAPNHTGKSALIDILLYALFDKCSRGRTVSDYLNRSCNSFNCMVTFAIGDQLYRIEKIGQSKPSKLAKDPLYRKVEVKIMFSMKNQQGWVSLNEPTTVQTKGKITELLGDYQDFLLTSVALQDKGLGMLTMTQTERKTLISKLFRLDIFDDLHKSIKKQHNLNKGSLEELKRLSSDYSSDDLHAEYNKIDDQYQQRDMDKCILDAQVDSFPQQLIQLHQRLVKLPDQSSLFVNIKEETQKLEKELVTLDKTIDSKKSVIELSQQIQKLSDKLVIIGKTLPDVNKLLTTKQQELKDTKDADKNNNKKVKQLRATSKKLIKQKEQLSIACAKKKEKNHIENQIDEKKQVLVKLTKLKVATGCASCKANLATFAPEQLKIEQQLPELENAYKSIKLSKKDVESEYNNVLKEWTNADSELEQLEQLQTYLPNQIEDVARIIGELKQQNKDYTIQLKQLNTNATHQEKIDNLVSQFTQLEQRNNVKDKLELIRKEGDNIIHNQQIQEDINKTQQDYQLVKDKLSAINHQTTSLKHQLDMKEHEEKKQKQIEDRIKLLSQENEIFIALEKCYHINGIPCILMEKYIPRVQTEVNRILDRIAPFMVEICVYNQSVELYKVPNNGSGRVHLECTSGFEKFVASLALRIAFRNFSLIGQPNFMILDEGFSSADATNVVGFGPMFNYLREQFQFVIMVSHIGELKQEADDTLALEVVGTKSRIVYV